MLVTTVAALGWVAKTSVDLPWNEFTLVCLGLSVIFAIFTLALIPLVAEKISLETKSIYTVKPNFTLIWSMKRSRCKLCLKDVCWPQHVLFILGILSYTLSAATA